MNYKLLAIILIFVGEAVAILAEMIAARQYGNNRPLLQLFLKMFLMFAVGGGFLVAGYMLGYKSFQNIWTVSVISITSILVIEPVLAYAVFQQLPTRGALIGLIFGVLGFTAAVFI